MAHHVVTDFGALVVESLCDLECTLRTAWPLHDSQLARDAFFCVLIPARALAETCDGRSAKLRYNLCALPGVELQRSCDYDQKHYCRSCYPHSLHFCRFGRSTNSSSQRDERKCQCGRDSGRLAGWCQQQRPCLVSSKSTRLRVQSEERLRERSHEDGIASGLVVHARKAARTSF
jgi:hypothetical protein